MYKIGDRVIFKAQAYKQYAWRLNDFEEYTIINKALSNENSTDYIPNTIYYVVKDNNGNETTWFEYDINSLGAYIPSDEGGYYNFCSLKQFRKQKLKRLMLF